MYYLSNSWTKKVSCPTNKGSHRPIWCITDQIVGLSLSHKQGGLIHQSGILLVKSLVGECPLSHKQRVSYNSLVYYL
jgi:hypothetical protein